MAMLSTLNAAYGPWVELRLCSFVATTVCRQPFPGSYDDDDDFVANAYDLYSVMCDRPAKTFSLSCWPPHIST